MNQSVISAQFNHPDDIVFTIIMLIYFYCVKFNFKHAQTQQRAKQWNMTLLCYLRQPINLIHSA